MKLSGIYAIFNTANGMAYIGQTTDYHQRIIQHKSDLKKGRHRNAYVQRDYDKYGKQYFIYQMLKYASVENLDRLEQEYIKIFNSDDRGFGYNIYPGGFSFSGMPMETRQKISENSARFFLGKKRPEIAEMFLGRIMSSEARLKMSIAATGRTHTDQTRERLREIYILNIGGRKEKQRLSAMKRVKNLETGEMYESIAVAALALGKSVNTVHRWLNNICEPKILIAYA